MGFSLEGVRLTHANGFHALRGVDLHVAAGERVALIGASGAGKTTLLRVLAASLRPTGGRVRLLGGEPWVDSPRVLRRLRSRIGLVHQAPPIPPRQRVVTAVLAGRLGQWPLWKALASLVLPVDPEGAARELARLDMAERLYARCDRLSGGQLQRVALARVLYQQPELLLADEPVSAMDPALSELTVALLNDEARRRVDAAADEMALLTETFLLLGRKEAVERPPQQVAPLIRRELTRLAPLLQRETLDIRLQLDEESEVQAPLSLLAIALGDGSIAAATGQVVLASVLFSMIAAPFLIRYNHALASRLTAAAPPKPAEAPASAGKHSVHSRSTLYTPTLVMSANSAPTGAVAAL